MLPGGNPFTLAQATEHTSVQGFCRIFKENLDSLYRLALALTLHNEKAEQCLIASFETCIEGRAVFKEWALSWSKRAIIKNAIRIVAPAPGKADDVDMSVTPGKRDFPGVPATLLHLRTFDRFVFVMIALEGYSHRDSALLLNCLTEDVIRAGGRALRQMRKSDANFLSWSGTQPVSGPGDTEAA